MDIIAFDFEEFLGTSEVLDARRQGAPTEAYKQYVAKRSDRPSSVAGYRGGWKGNTADDALMVDQGFVDTPSLFLYSPFAQKYDSSLKIPAVPLKAGQGISQM